MRTISAPRARSTLTFSLLIFSGMTITHLYPFTAETRARPIPVCVCVCVAEISFDRTLTQGQYLGISLHDNSLVFLVP